MNKASLSTEEVQFTTARKGCMTSLWNIIVTHAAAIGQRKRKHIEQVFDKIGL